MDLQQEVKAFLESPSPLWNSRLTKLLIQHEWNSLERKGITPQNYSTNMSHDINLSSGEVSTFLIAGHQDPERSIYLEYPSFISLGTFYEEFGLEPLDYPKEEKNELIKKLQAALTVFDAIPAVKTDISLLVKRIQVLEQHDEEIDTSYSHPDIPFTIFISLCKDNSPTNNLRVAESVLHETMHLKLTLIEKHIDLIVPGTEETFYSPWRDEQRPARGVLHGLLVFACIICLYKELLKIEESAYLRSRIEDIEDEISCIINFQFSKGLSENGKLLCSTLLQLGLS